MASEVVLTLVKAVAPTVASKLIEAVGDKKLKSQDLNLLILAQNAEMLTQMNNHLQNLEAGIKNCSEGIAVLLQRTK